MLLFSSLSAFKRKNKNIGIINLCVSLIVFYAFFQILFTQS
ncbi:hypothetical protein [Paenibacillus sp. 1_12]